MARKNQNLGWLENEDYQGIGGYSAGVSGGYYSSTSPAVAAQQGYSNPLVSSELQSFISSNTVAPTATAEVTPMGYYGGGSYYGTGGGSYYGTGGGSYSPSDIPDYVNVTGSNFNYTPDSGIPDYVEQVNVTGYVPPPQQVTSFDNPIFNPSGDYSSLVNTPTLPDYGKSQEQVAGGAGDGDMPSAPMKQGGGSGGGSSGGGGQAPQPKQQQQPPVNIFNILGKSGSGQAGGNTGALYNPALQGGYGSAGQYGNASAGYNAPSIVPYLLIGGLGLVAYRMLSKKHHE